MTTRRSFVLGAAVAPMVGVPLKAKAEPALIVPRPITLIVSGATTIKMIRDTVDLYVKDWVSYCPVGDLPSGGSFGRAVCLGLIGDRGSAAGDWLQKIVKPRVVQERLTIYGLLGNIRHPMYNESVAADPVMFAINVAMWESQRLQIQST